ncbi:von Willebrand factor A domain-containing protein 7 isoform X2 [Oryzias melastigma]|uniref:von Willebrand factor A domain-containing protein 7-like n=1 Tax=Oryzias melastigma TaxID=30732 RepID=A0A3B3BUG2_ORYME|nr:von Willebrand factor A domain-containing protein 7 isoform X2 [Oryzias melastigma]
MATAATSELLEEVRRHTGDKAFLEMIGISKGSSKALCFVIDTSNSMRDNIEAVKTVTSKIIKSDSGTDMQPSSYILVTFSDPEFKLEEKTSNSKVFQKAMDSLNITGGGDKPEMSLSGLQLALTNAPFNSEIFLFTDAPAKDKNLKSTVTALIERTQTVVNFMITESSLSNRRRRRDGQNSIGAEDIQLYRDLAQASGGLVIEVTKAELSKAASIITQSTRGSEVTFLQASRNPGKSDTFTFTADETVKTLRVYITGQSVTFTITDPKGATQKSTDSSGPLIKISESVGNFIFVQLLTQVGEWKIQMESTNPYTLKVIGQSYIDFLLEFVEPSGIFSGFDALDTRPRAGHNGTLMVSLSGSDDATITDVALVESSGSKEVKIVLEPQEGGRYFVHFDQIPRQEFDVRVTGKLAGSSNVFRRQSPISFKASNLTITANSSSIIVPGTPFSFPFSVTNSGDETTLTIRVTNNRLFPSTYPSTLPVEKGKSSTGTVTLSAPLNTPSGTDVVLTIEVATPGATDVNYIVLRFSIVNSVTDFTAPVCKRLSKKSECSGKCDSKWEVSVRVTDGADGTGIERISVSRGTGTLKTSQEAGNENITLVSYSASCCSPELQLLVVDRVGNVNNCLISGNEFSTRLAQSSFLCLSLVAVGLHLLMELGFR